MLGLSLSLWQIALLGGGGGSGAAWVLFTGIWKDTAFWKDTGIWKD